MDEDEKQFTTKNAKEQRRAFQMDDGKARKACE